MLLKVFQANQAALCGELQDPCRARVSPPTSCSPQTPAPKGQILLALSSPRALTKPSPLSCSNGCPPGCDPMARCLTESPPSPGLPLGAACLGGPAEGVKPKHAEKLRQKFFSHSTLCKDLNLQLFWQIVTFQAFILSTPSTATESTSRLRRLPLHQYSSRRSEESSFIFQNYYS